jgi:class 3 adenylate cyclase
MNTEDLYNSSEQREVTVLFSDIRGFTTLSESMTPREVVNMLNDYLELMTKIIVKYQGVVDKFVGDEIFSVFGAPYNHPNHPLAAIAVALEMGVVLSRHNEERVAEGKHPINIGIGINTGVVIAGAMGSKKRVDYTSIGDAVNLGARLEGTNKVYGTLIIMSEFTHKKVKEWVVYRELDSIRVKGKLEPVLIYEVLDFTRDGRELADELVVEIHERKMEPLKVKEVSKPEVIPEKAPDVPPSEESKKDTPDEGIEQVAETESDEPAEQEEQGEQVEPAEETALAGQGEKNNIESGDTDGSVISDSESKITV